MTGFSVTSLRRHPACRFAARLVLLLFALRAILPVGYMPDLGALKNGQVQIVICTGSGTQALLVDASGQPVNDLRGDGPRHGAAGDCPFGMAMAKAFTLPPPVPAPAQPIFAHAFPPAGSDQALLPPAQGPPLGPRAPPILLG
jgi:hypothetical protein